MKSAIAIAAHPDDIEFLMSGTLMLLRTAGYKIHYWNLANGCCGSSKYDAATIARIRREEAYAAAKAIGATFHESICNDLEIFYDRPTAGQSGVGDSRSRAADRAHAFARRLHGGPYQRLPPGGDSRVCPRHAEFCHRSAAAGDQRRRDRLSRAALFASRSAGQCHRAGDRRRYDRPHRAEEADALQARQPEAMARRKPGTQFVSRHDGRARCRSRPHVEHLQVCRRLAAAFASGLLRARATIRCMRR